MAKTPKGSMDEEEIIWPRDGVASSDDPPAPDDRRALADALLRALGDGAAPECLHKHEPLTTIVEVTGQIRA